MYASEALPAADLLSGRNLGWPSAARATALASSADAQVRSDAGRHQRRSGHRCRCAFAAALPLTLSAVLIHEAGHALDFSTGGQLSKDLAAVDKDEACNATDSYGASSPAEVLTTRAGKCADVFESRPVRRTRVRRQLRAHRSDQPSVWKYLNPDKDLPSPWGATMGATAGCKPTAHVSMMLASMSSLGAFATTCLPGAQSTVKSVVSAHPITTVAGGGQRRRAFEPQATACVH